MNYAFGLLCNKACSGEKDFTRALSLLREEDSSSLDFRSQQRGETVSRGQGFTQTNWKSEKGVGNRGRWCGSYTTGQILCEVPVLRHRLTERLRLSWTTVQATPPPTSHLTITLLALQEINSGLQPNELQDTGSQT